MDNEDTALPPPEAANHIESVMNGITEYMRRELAPVGLDMPACVAILAAYIVRHVCDSRAEARTFIHEINKRMLDCINQEIIPDWGTTPAGIVAGLIAKSNALVEAGRTVDSFITQITPVQAGHNRIPVLNNHVAIWALLHTPEGNPPPPPERYMIAPMQDGYSEFDINNQTHASPLPVIALLHVQRDHVPYVQRQLQDEATALPLYDRLYARLLRMSGALS